MNPSRPASDASTPEIELESFGYTQQLKRSMGVWQLTAFGLNYMIPIAPAMVFGFIVVTSQGTVILPYLFAFVAMLFTANSYAIMVPNFPVAGSLYSYVSRGMNPHVGFVAGWLLSLDYVLIPTVTSVAAALAFQQLFPQAPYAMCLLLFTVATGLLNLFGVELMARFGLLLLLLGEVIVFLGFGMWGYAVAVDGIGVGHLLSLEPFRFSTVTALITATSLAVLSYLGFDAITTMAEEATNPKRDIPRAIYLSLIIGALTMCLTGYLAMLVMPDWPRLAQDPQWLGAALFHVAKTTGGHWFQILYTSGFLIAMAVFNVVGTAAGSRLLFGMGRDGVLPKRVFAAVNRKWGTPHWGICLIVLLEYALGLSLDMERIAEMVNFGALVSFVLLNISVMWLYFSKRNGRTLYQPRNTCLQCLFSPLCGALVLLWVVVDMDTLALMVGGIWLAIGVVYGAVRSQGYQYVPPQLEV